MTKNDVRNLKIKSIELASNKGYYNKDSDDDSIFGTLEKAKTIYEWITSD